MPEPQDRHRDHGRRQGCQGDQGGRIEFRVDKHANLAFIVGKASFTAEQLTENYAADHNIGKQGIEHYYENELHGKTGYQEVEVDNHGRIVRLIKDVPPVAGKDIHLTLDLHLQQYIESLLAGQRAAVLVRRIHTDGSVLAMVSNPTAIDPNPFVKGIMLSGL